MAREMRTRIRPRRRRPVHSPLQASSPRGDTGSRVTRPPPAPAWTGGRPPPRTGHRGAPLRPTGGRVRRPGSIVPCRACHAGRVRSLQGHPRSRPHRAYRGASVRRVRAARGVGPPFAPRAGRGERDDEHAGRAGHGAHQRLGVRHPGDRTRRRDTARLDARQAPGGRRSASAHLAGASRRRSSDRPARPVAVCGPSPSAARRAGRPRRPRRALAGEPTLASRDRGTRSGPTTSAGADLPRAAAAVDAGARPVLL